MSERNDSEEQAPTLVVGPNMRITIVGVALVGLLAGLCSGTWAVAVGLERFNRNMEERMTHGEMLQWTLDARAQLPQLPLYIPPKRKD